MAMELMWLGQGGYLIKCAGVTICLDPYLSDSCEKSGGHTRIAPPPVDPGLIDADVIVLTHDHMDHLDEGTLRQMDLKNNLFAAPASCRAHLAALGVPEERMLAFDRGESFCLGETELCALYADHTQDSIGLLVRDTETCAYFTGDTLFSEELILQALPFRPDILVVCINGRWGNMNVEEAVRLAKALDVKIAIPSHYGMFAENTADPLEFIEKMGGKGCDMLEMYRHVVFAAPEGKAEA